LANVSPENALGLLLFLLSGGLGNDERPAHAFITLVDLIGSLFSSFFNEFLQSRFTVASLCL